MIKIKPMSVEEAKAFYQKEYYYIDIYKAVKENKYFCENDYVSIICNNVVDAPNLSNYSESAILLEIDIFIEKNEKLIKYNGFKQHHNTTMFADLMSSLVKLNDEEKEDFLKKEKIFLNKDNREN